MLGVVTLARLAFASAIPLTEDEAYYRLWAQHISFGYFDHPPMIAWWIRCGELIGGDTSLGARLFPILGCAATSLLIFDLAHQLGFGDRVAVRAGIWFQAMLMIALGGILATPDACATFFWTLTLCCVVRAEQALPGRRWWLAAGAAAGLGMLSKYSDMFLAPGLLLALLFRKNGSASLRTPWPWLAVALACAVFAPNFAWNATHHWETFARQFGRIRFTALAPRYVVELVVGQALLLNPLITPFVVKGVRAAIAAGRASGKSDARLFLLASVAPFTCYLLVHALHARVQGHWPTPLYPALALIAASAANELRARPLKRIASAVVPAGLAIGAICLAHVALPWTDIAGIKDPTAMVRGWPGFARRVDALQHRADAGWIGTASYATTAELDDQDGLSGPVVQLNERRRYPWASLSSVLAAAAPGLVIDLTRRLDLAGLKQCFAHVVPLEPIERASLRSRPVRYAVFEVSEPRFSPATGCASLRGRPAPTNSSRSLGLKSARE